MRDKKLMYSLAQAVVVAMAISSVAGHRPCLDVVEVHTKQECQNKKGRGIYKVNVNGESCHICCLCGPGFYKIQDCKENHPMETVCGACKFDADNSTSQTYTATENNETQCFISPNDTQCEGLQNTYRIAGSTTEASRCICRNGSYSDWDITKYGCNEHSPCTEGYQPAIPGTTSNDTRCQPCPSGTFSNASSPTSMCMPFSDCVSDKIIQPGTSKRDVVCMEKNNTQNQTTATVCLPLPWFVILVIGELLPFFLLLGWYCCCKRVNSETPEKKTKATQVVPEDLKQQQELGANGSQAADPEQLLDRPKGGDAKAKKLRDGELSVETSEDGEISDEQEPEKKPLLAESKAFEDTNEALRMKRPKDEQGPVAEPQYKFAEAPPAPDEAPPRDTLPKDKIDDYKEMFRKKGYYIAYDPKGDGDCQFSSIAHQMWPDLTGNELQQKAREIRLQSTHWMEMNHNHFEDFGYRFEGDWAKYINEMKDKEYGDDITLQAACEVYGLSIMVICTKEPNVSKKPRSSEQHSQLQDVLLGYINGGEHYVSLEQIQSDVSGVGADSCTQGDNVPSHLNVHSSLNGSGVQRPSDHVKHEPAPLENGVMEDHHHSLSPSGDPPSQLNTHSPSESGPQRASSQGTRELEVTENVTSGDLSLHENGGLSASDGSENSEQIQHGRNIRTQTHPTPNCPAAAEQTDSIELEEMGSKEHHKVAKSPEGETGYATSNLSNRDQDEQLKPV